MERSRTFRPTLDGAAACRGHCLPTGRLGSGELGTSFRRSWVSAFAARTKPSPLIWLSLAIGTEARVHERPITATATAGIALSQLQRWLARTCDGDWEHQLGLEIRTLDNPGWMVDLTNTALDSADFDHVRNSMTSANGPLQGRGSSFTAPGAPTCSARLSRICAGPSMRSDEPHNKALNLSVARLRLRKGRAAIESVERQVFGILTGVGVEKARRRAADLGEVKLQRRLMRCRKRSGCNVSSMRLNERNSHFIGSRCIDICHCTIVVIVGALFFG